MDSSDLKSPTNRNLSKHLADDMGKELSAHGFKVEKKIDQNGLTSLVIKDAPGELGKIIRNANKKGIEVSYAPIQSNFMQCNTKPSTTYNQKTHQIEIDSKFLGKLSESDIKMLNNTVTDSNNPNFVKPTTPPPTETKTGSFNHQNAWNESIDHGNHKPPPTDGRSR
jgi:hypothetical protein